MSGTNGGSASRHRGAGHPVAPSQSEGHCSTLTSSLSVCRRLDVARTTCRARLTAFYKATGDKTMHA